MCLQFRSRSGNPPLCSREGPQNPWSQTPCEIRVRFLQQALSVMGPGERRLIRGGQL